MKPWHVAALSALLIMGLMTWPSIRAIIKEPDPNTVVTYDVGSDFELTRQDGRDMRLSEVMPNGGWLTFMGPACGERCEQALRSAQAERVVVVSTEPDLSAQDMANWLAPFGVNFVGFVGREGELRKVWSSFRLPRVSDADFPVRWYEVAPGGRVRGIQGADFIPTR